MDCGTFEDLKRVMENKSEHRDVRIAAIESILRSSYRNDISYNDLLRRIATDSGDKFVKARAIEALGEIDDS